MLTRDDDQSIERVSLNLEAVDPDMSAMIRLMLGQPYQRPRIESLITFIEEQIMWEMAHRRKDFDKINRN